MYKVDLYGKMFVDIYLRTWVGLDWLDNSKPLMAKCERA